MSFNVFFLNVVIAFFHYYYFQNNLVCMSWDMSWQLVVSREYWRTTPASNWTQVTFAGTFTCCLPCCSWEANLLSKLHTDISGALVLTEFLFGCPFNIMFESWIRRRLGGKVDVNACSLVSVALVMCSMLQSVQPFDWLYPSIVFTFVLYSFELMQNYLTPSWI